MSEPKEIRLKFFMLNAQPANWITMQTETTEINHLEDL